MPKKLQLIVMENEPRIDSRLFEDRLGIQHKTLNRTIQKYEIDFIDLGTLPIENETCSHKTGAVREKYYLLNEEQSIFLLTLSKNTRKVIDLKKDLSKKFAAYRKKELREAKRQVKDIRQKIRLEGITARTDFTDAIQKVVEWAEESGSRNGRRYYNLFTGIVYKTLFGVSKVPENFRDSLDEVQLRHLQSWESMGAVWIQEAMAACEDYHCPYKYLKEKFSALAGLVTVEARA